MKLIVDIVKASKYGIGKRVEQVLVQRNGKTFYRRQKVGAGFKLKIAKVDKYVKLIEKDLGLKVHFDNDQNTDIYLEDIATALQVIHDEYKKMPKEWVRANNFLKKINVNVEEDSKHGTDTLYAYYNKSNKDISLTNAFKDIEHSGRNIVPNIHNKKKLFIQDALVHELGHAVMAKIYSEPLGKLQLSNFFQNAGVWVLDGEEKLSHTNLTAITSYANTNPQEEFAEYFSVYWHNRNLINKILDEPQDKNIESSFELEYLVEFENKGKILLRGWTPDLDAMRSMRSLCFIDRIKKAFDTMKLIIKAEDSNKPYAIMLSHSASVCDLSNATVHKTKHKSFRPDKSKKQILKATTEEILKAFDLDVLGELRKSLVYKDYMDKSLGRKRETMPQVSADNLNEFLLHFGKNKVAVTKVQRTLNKLKPAQTEFNDDKVVDFADGGFNDKKQYIISRDNYLLDGHHAWAANLEHKPAAKVNCYRINLPIKELLRRANILKLTHKEDINGDKLEKASWSQTLMEKNRPARWVTYNGSHILIKLHPDGTGTVIFAGGNQTLEHMRIIPKTHEEYEGLKKESEKYRNTERKNDEFTPEEIAQMREAAYKKSDIHHQLKTQYYEKLIQIANLQDVNVEDLLHKHSKKIENKADVAIDGETLKQVMEQVDNQEDKKVKRAAEQAIQQIATNQVVTDHLGDSPVAPVLIDTGNKELDKKLRKLVLSKEQALQIQALKTDLHNKLKEVNKDFEGLIKNNQKNIITTSMQGIGVYDLNQEPTTIEKAIESAIKDTEQRKRAELNTEFYNAIDQRGTGIDKRVVEGAQDTINALAGKFLQGSSISKELIDFVGVENASRVIAGQIANAGKGKLAKEQIKELLELRSEDLVKETLSKLQEQYNRIQDYDKLSAEGVLAVQTANINKARQIATVNTQLGGAAGSLQAAATVLDALHNVEESKGDIVVAGGKNLIVLREKLKSMGLDEKDYFTKREGSNIRCIIPQESFGKLLSDKSISAKRDVLIAKIKNNELYDKDWLPAGTSATWYDWKTPKEFTKLPADQKKLYEAYKNKVGEAGYASQFNSGEPLYRRKMDGDKGFKILPSQQRMIQMAEANKRVIWNAGAGIGKTIAFLGLVSELKAKNKINFGVITVPSRLVDEFRKDHDKFFPHLKMINLTKFKGMEAKERLLQEAANGRYDIVISGHDSVKGGLGKDAKNKYFDQKIKDYMTQHNMKFSVKLLNKTLRKKIITDARETARDELGLPALIAKYKPGFVGVDEAHEAFKDLDLKESQKFSAIKTLAKGSEYFVPATGTTVRNRIGEVASLASITNPEKFPNASKFTKKWHAINQLSSIMQGGSVDSFRRELDPVMISEKTKIPAKLNESQIKVTLSPQQRDAYKRSEQIYHLDRKTTGYGILDSDGNLVTTPDGKGLVTIPALANINIKPDADGKIAHDDQTRAAFKQAGYDPQKFTVAKLGALGASTRRDSRHSKILHNGDWHTNAKINQMLDNVQKLGLEKKHLIFYEDKASLATLKQAFKDKFGLDKVPYIEGESTPKSRADAITKFQTDDDAPVIFLSTAGMTGVNLQRGNYNHWLKRVNTAALQQQGNARSYRTGRDGDVGVFYYDSDTPFDNNRIDLIIRKQKLMDSVGEYHENEGLESELEKTRKSKNIKKAIRLMIKL